MESVAKHAPSKSLKVILILAIALLLLQVFSGVYRFYANKSCADQAIAAMGISHGEQVLFLSKGGSGDAEKGRAYQAYHQFCLNKQFGV
jgi:hypothetical protein